jgi:hypothetical protein
LLREFRHFSQTNFCENRDSFRRLAAILVILQVLDQIARLLAVCHWNLIDRNVKRTSHAPDHRQVGTNPFVPLD